MKTWKKYAITTVTIAAAAVAGFYAYRYFGDTLLEKLSNNADDGVESTTESITETADAVTEKVAEVAETAKEAVEEATK